MSFKNQNKHKIRRCKVIVNLSLASCKAVLGGHIPVLAGLFLDSMCRILNVFINFVLQNFSFLFYLVI